MNGQPTYRIEEFEVTRSRDRPRAKWELGIVAELSSRALDPDATVIEFQEVPPPVKPWVREVMYDSPYLTNDAPPSALHRVLEEYDYVRYQSPEELRGHPSQKFVEMKLFHNDLDRPPLLQFDAELRDPTIAPGDPGSIEFRLENTSDESLMIESIEPWPFGVVRSLGEDWLELWNDGYEEHYPVATHEQVPGNLYMQHRTAPERKIVPHEEIVRVYDLPLSNVEKPGTFQIIGVWGYEPSDCRRETIQFEIEFKIV